MASEVLIRAGTVIDGTGASPQHDVSVWVRDGTIQVVRAAADPIPGVAPNAELIDASGLTLLPGLIDTHVHLAFSAGEHPLTDLLSEGDDRMILRAAGNAQVALRAGITTVRDAGGRRSVVLALRDAIRDGLLPGPRVVASGMPITTTAGHCYWLGLEADSADEVRKAARTLHRLGADYFKVMATGGGMTPGSMPLHPQYTVDQLAALVEEARRLGRTVAAHVHGTAGIRNAVAAGVTTLEHCSWLGDGGTAFDEAVAEEIVRKGIYVNPTAGISFTLDARSDSLTPAQKQLLARRESRTAAHRRQVELGTKMTAGTDAGVARAPFDCLIQNLQVMVEHLGMAPVAAIRAATGLAAESMRLDHEIGTIQPGKRADLILVDGDPLAAVGTLRHVRRVFQDGRTVVVGKCLC
ncbi:MAG: amidohydrolase family protein [Chloroflexi bacterium]|nr:amidohydrolase family protein [Chloroflexota bacterium]